MWSCTHWLRIMFRALSRSVCIGSISRLSAHQTRFAQFLTRCSASTLAEKLTTCSPLQSPSPAKTRTSSRPSRAHGHHLRPSTNCYKLSDQLYGVCSTTPLFCSNSSEAVERCRALWEGGLMGSPGKNYRGLVVPGRGLSAQRMVSPAVLHAA